MEYLIIRPSFWHEIEIDARDVSRLAIKLVIFAQLELTHKGFKVRMLWRVSAYYNFLKDSYHVYDVMIMKLWKQHSDYNQLNYQMSFVSIIC